ncbi:MAG: 6-phosphogluconolactonase [Verrucomicrobiota bacterium]
MELNEFENENAWIEALMENWRRVGGEALQRRGDFKVALAGGKTPEPFYKKLATAEWPWEATKCFITDERWVPIEKPESNYRMIYQAFYPRKIQLYRWKTELTKPEEAAADYERVLFSEAGRPPRFDLVILSIGEDGHTASLFADTPPLLEEKRNTAWCYVQKLEAYRLTMTLPLLNIAREIWFVAQGKNKLSWMKELTEEDVSFPAGIVAHPQGDQSKNRYLQERRCYGFFCE